MLNVLCGSRMIQKQGVNFAVIMLVGGRLSCGQSCCYPAGVYLGLQRPSQARPNALQKGALEYRSEARQHGQCSSLQENVNDHCVYSRWCIHHSHNILRRRIIIEFSIMLRLVLTQNTMKHAHVGQAEVTLRATALGGISEARQSHRCMLLRGNSRALVRGCDLANSNVAILGHETTRCVAEGCDFATIRYALALYDFFKVAMVSTPKWNICFVLERHHFSSLRLSVLHSRDLSKRATRSAWPRACPRTARPACLTA